MSLPEVRMWLNVMLAMHVVRMIKFFAWEKRIEDQLADKRDDELTWIKRSKLLTVVNDNIKYVCIETSRLPIILTSFLSSDLIPLLTMVVTYATFVSLRTLKYSCWFESHHIPYRHWP